GRCGRPAAAAAGAFPPRRGLDRRAAPPQGDRHLRPAAPSRRQVEVPGRRAALLRLSRRRAAALSGIRAAARTDRCTCPPAARGGARMKALVFAAGLGERMRPLTNTTPKPLLVASGKPLLERHQEKLAAIGVRAFVVNPRWLADQRPQVLGDGSRWGLRRHFLYE